MAGRRGVPVSGAKIQGAYATSYDGYHREAEEVVERAVCEPISAAPPGASSSKDPPFLVGLVDGHGKGGDELALVVRSSFADMFSPNLSPSGTSAAPRPTPAELQLAGGRAIDEPVGRALITTFTQIDSRILSDTARGVPPVAGTLKSAGAVAAFVWVGVTGATPRREIYAANVGTVEVVVAEAFEAVPLSRRHRCSERSEEEAIIRRGGRVVGGRVVLPSGESLSPSRTLGDADFKGVISCVPSCARHVIGEETDFILIASEGLWDRLSHDEAVREVYDFAARADRSGLRDVARHLIGVALEKPFRRDNPTEVPSVVVVFLRPPPTQLPVPPQPPEIESIRPPLTATPDPSKPPGAGGPLTQAVPEDQLLRLELELQQLRGLEAAPAARSEDSDKAAVAAAAVAEAAVATVAVAVAAASTTDSDSPRDRDRACCESGSSRICADDGCRVQ